MKNNQLLKGRNRVLVVDDDPGMREGLQRLLWLHGYEPILFSSAKAFRTHTDFDNVVCVILDINLGDGSGLELLSGLQTACSALPVVCITGDENPAVRTAALSLGCIAFLAKPFAFQELIEPLKRAVARRCQDHPRNFQF